MTAGPAAASTGPGAGAPGRHAASPAWRDDTITSFPAIRDDAPEPAAPAQSCRCGSPACPDAATPPFRIPDVRVLLHCGPGIVSRMWRKRVASGEWDDIPSLADRAHARIHLPALDGNRRIRAGLAAARHDIASLFGADPRALSDEALGDGLRDMGARIGELGEQMHAEVEARLENMRAIEAGTGAAA